MDPPASHLSPIRSDLYSKDRQATPKIMSESNRRHDQQPLPQDEELQSPSRPLPTSPSLPNDPRPPSGHRILLRTDAQFPPARAYGPSLSIDSDGRPVYIGSALFDRAVHPCKIVPHLEPTPVHVPYGAGEHEHHGSFDLLPIVPEQMEWVTTSYGRIPSGRTPIVGGYEGSGLWLYHAVATIDGERVPGKTGEHLVRIL